MSLSYAEQDETHSSFKHKIKTEFKTRRNCHFKNTCATMIHIYASDDDMAINGRKAINPILSLLCEQSIKLMKLSILYHGKSIYCNTNKI